MNIQVMAWLASEISVDSSRVPDFTSEAILLV